MARVSYTVPSPAGRPEHTTSSPDSITVAYSRPNSDGGSEITGTVRSLNAYFIEWIELFHC